MRDLFGDDASGDSWKAWLRRFFLDLDSRIDFGLYQARTWGRELYERFTVFMDRFHVAGAVAHGLFDGGLLLDGAGQVFVEGGVIVGGAWDADVDDGEPGSRGHRLAVARREVIDDGDVVAGSDAAVDDVRADEPRATRDENSHGGRLR